MHSSEDDFFCGIWNPKETILNTHVCYHTSPFLLQASLCVNKPFIGHLYITAQWNLELLHHCSYI